MTIAVEIRGEAEGMVPPLSALEWKVVSLAMREAGEPGGASGAGWISRMFGRASGFRPKLPLADPRLETLRRFVGRLCDRADVSDLKRRLIELGFHPGQISAVTLLAR